MKDKIRSRCWSAYIMFVLLVAISLIGCGTDISGENTRGISRNIGPSGGTVEVTDTSNPVFGVRIEIPPGALSKETTITLSKAVNPPPFPSESNFEETVVNIGPSGTQFQIPVTVTIPYKDVDNDGLLDNTPINENVLTVFQHDEGAINWENIPIYDLDTTFNKITFQVSHLTEFTTEPWSRIKPGITKFFIKGVMDPNQQNSSVNSTANTTVANAILEVWKTETDCAGIIFEQVFNENDANLVIEWYPSKNWGTNGAATCDAGFMCPMDDLSIDWKNKWRILINPLINWNVDKNKTTSDTQYDLYSNIGHEIAHVLGLPPSHLPNTDPHAVIDASLSNGEETRTLKPEDIAFFDSMYSSDPPVFLEYAPIGTISSHRPNISVRVKTFCENSIDLSSIRLKLDSNIVSHNSAVIDGSEVDVSFTPQQDLSPGKHVVNIEASDANGRADTFTWEFEVIDDSGGINPALIGTWHLSTVNGQALIPGVFLTWKFTESTVTITSDLDCVEVITGESTGGVLKGTSVVSQVGSECGDASDEIGVIGTYTVTGDTLTVIVTDKEINPSTATFVFIKG